MNHKGLTNEEVSESRKRYGANRQQSGRKQGSRIVLEVVREPMVALLLAACLFYFLLEEYREGLIMLGAIVIVAGISVYQQIRSESALQVLNTITSDKITVIRDGKEAEIDAEEVVTGDIMKVSEGELIIADAEVLDGNDFFADESTLTGESIAVDKSEIGSLISSGTTATSGMAWTRVTAVGSMTNMSKLGKVMDETLKGKTPLQNQVNNFVRKMTFFGIIAFLLVWGYNYFLSEDILQSLLQGLTLAMSVLPEEIPVAMATFMALGAYRLIRKNILARHPQIVESLGAATVICVDKTGTITENRMAVSGYYDFKDDRLHTDAVFKTPNELELILISKLASEDDPFDPMEKAIHEKYNESFTMKDDFLKTFEYPLSGKHPMMTHVFKDKHNERIIACKGAPEGILEKSGLDAGQKQKISENLKKLASNGYRVLAVAKGIYDNGTLPESQEEFKLDFLGLIALSDPPKKNIPEVINQFYDAGLKVKMITGDYPSTAMSIAHQIGLQNADSCITGDEINVLEGENLIDAVTKNSVFARVMPEVKLKIIKSLKASGEVVAMTGDGVNDGPALKAAHIGVAMGKRGSTFARKASSLVLLDDDLGGMITALEFGRNIYNNLKKAIQYIISIHIPLISVVTLPLLLAWKFPNIFSPVHVIFLELIMGPTCSIVYENEPIDQSLKKLKPRRNTDSLFTWNELSRAVIQGLVIAACLLIFMYYLVTLGGDEAYIRTMIFTSLVLSNIILTLTGRSVSETIATTIQKKNKLVPVIIVITILLLFTTLYLPFAKNIFMFTSLNGMDLLKCMAVAAIAVGWIEVWKGRRSHRS